MSRNRTEDRPQPDDRLLATLDYIDMYQRSHVNRSPVERRIRAALNMGAPAVVQTTLQRLVSARLLTITRAQPGLPAELSVTDLGQERLRAWRAGRPAPEQPADESS